jgi:hypothetical protein
MVSAVPASPASHPRPFLPVEVVFNPNWWYHNAGIEFTRPFYLDAQVRIENDQTMRRVLYEQFGQFGLGEADPQPRPLIGSLHVAGGFAIPALLGAEILFERSAAPQPLPLNLPPQALDELIERLAGLDFRQAWPFSELIPQMDALEAGWGFLVGDLNTDGLLNAAYHVYGMDLFTDFFHAPQRVQRLLEQIARLIVEAAAYLRQRTGSCSISVNRMAGQFDPALFIHANCSVPMISPRSYRAMQLPFEMEMAAKMRPFGIHHCGADLQRYAPHYAELEPAFVDVGWGSDPAECRKALPEAFFNLRLSPVRMLSASPQEIAADTESLLRAAGPLELAGVCCINMDYGTPPENLAALFRTVERFRAQHGHG